MSLEKSKVSAQEAREMGQVELKRAAQKPVSDPKRHPLVKLFKAMDDNGKLETAALAATEIQRRFSENQRIDLNMYLFCSCIASERHWDSARKFLDSVLVLSGDANLFREVAISLLEIADMELSGPSSRLPIAETALVMLTEYGLMLANQEGRSSLDHKGASHVVEYISTSLLARSNINNTAMRISLIHFLSSCADPKQSTLQLNRVISRFGNTLLEDLLRAFFDDKKKVTAAFFFLVEHLHAFLSSSPALATMSHDVLKHHMLKYPEDFPGFLASYCDWSPKDPGSQAILVRHIGMLYRSALDVYQRPLAEAIGRVLIRLLDDIKNRQPEALKAYIETVFGLIGVGVQTTANRQMLLQELVLELQALDGDARAAQRVITMARAKRVKDGQVKLAKVGEKPSPLESMLQLAG